MKIAIISTIENYSWAGTEEVWALFAKQALSNGHDVMLAAHHKVAGSDNVKKLVQAGLKVVQRHPFRPMRIYLAKEKFSTEMKALIDFKADVVLINSGSLFDVINLPYVYRVCNLIKAPKVFFCHFVAETLIPTNYKQLQSFFSTMDSVLFVSEHNKNLAERQLAMKFKNAAVIANGSKQVLTEPISWPDGDTINFAIVARLEIMWKGHDVLLETLSKPVWRNRKWQLNIYGEGPDIDYIKDLIAFYGLGDKVFLKGYVYDIKQVWANNHAMLLPTRGEGMPLAVIEAMMCGRPVITTDAGGNLEILDTGVNGWVADAATSFSFGKILEQAWTVLPEWKNIGIAAHVRALKLVKDDPAGRLIQLLQRITSPNN